jgi:hypothetical protein
MAQPSTKENVAVKPPHFLPYFSFQPSLSRQPHLPTELAGVVGDSIIAVNLTASLSN